MKKISLRKNLEKSFEFMQLTPTLGGAYKLEERHMTHMTAMKVRRYLV